MICLVWENSVTCLDVRLKHGCEPKLDCNFFMQHFRTVSLILISPIYNSSDHLLVTRQMQPLAEETLENLLSPEINIYQSIDHRFLSWGWKITNVARTVADRWWYCSMSECVNKELFARTPLRLCIWQLDFEFLCSPVSRNEENQL